MTKSIPLSSKAHLRRPRLLQALGALVHSLLRRRAVGLALLA